LTASSLRRKLQCAHNGRGDGNGGHQVANLDEFTSASVRSPTNFEDRWRDRLLVYAEEVWDGVRSSEPIFGRPMETQARYVGIGLCVMPPVLSRHTATMRLFNSVLSSPGYQAHRREQLYRVSSFAWTAWIRWNRLLRGPRVFYQIQCVITRAAGGDDAQISRKIATQRPGLVSPASSSSEPELTRNAVLPRLR